MTVQLHLSLLYIYIYIYFSTQRRTIDMATPSSDAPFLLVGGTGTVGSRLASILQSTGNKVLIASRSDASSPNNNHVKFDWFDDSTYSNAFSHPLAASSGGLRGAYLIAPPSLDMVAAMKSFIDLLRSKGVRRFVLLSATSIAKGDPILTGLIHEYLDQLGEAGEVEWAVLRPTWFMGM
jgi:festuclavine dehydrogenase